MSAIRIRIVAPWGPGASPLQPFVTASLGVHLLVVLGIVFFPAIGGKKTRFEPTMSVSLIAGPPAPTVQTPAAPPKPAPTPPKVETKPEPAPPKEDLTAKPVEPTINPDKAPEKPIDVEPESVPDAVGTEGESGADPQEDLLETGVGGAQFPGMEGTEFDWYRAAINRALSVAWRRPYVQTTFDSLDVMIGFEILRDGSVRGVEILESSGVPALDRSAQRAVMEATLPGLPRNFREPSQAARVVFRYFPDSM